jgi:hypothetical protein
MQIQIFHYEPAYKFYIGTEVIQDSRPNIGFPAHSTDIKPPLEKIKEGEIPVFNGSGWDIVADTFWRPKVRELNYDAARMSNTYKPLALSMYGHQFPLYPSMPMLCNTSLVIQAICQKTRLVHQKFEAALQLHKQVLSNDLSGAPLDTPDYQSLAASPTILYTYKLEVEAIVYLMRRILDSFVQLSYLLTNYADFESTKTIAYNEIGRFLDKKSALTDLDQIIIGSDDGYAKDSTDFLRVINDLFNSFKHCLMHDESYNLVSVEIPSVTSYQAKNNNHKNEVVYHNHNLYHLMMGFQDSIMRILNNQKHYLAINSRT